MKNNVVRSLLYAYGPEEQVLLTRKLQTRMLVINFFSPKLSRSKTQWPRMIYITHNGDTLVGKLSTPPVY